MEDVGVIEDGERAEQEGPLLTLCPNRDLETFNDIKRLVRTGRFRSGRSDSAGARSAPITW